MDGIGVLVDKLDKFVTDNVFTYKMKENLSQINQKKFNEIIQILNNQKSLKDTSCSLYKFNFFKETLEHSLDIFDIEPNNTIQIEDTNIIFQMISPKLLKEYIFKHLDNKYIFISITFFCESITCGHQVILAFNNPEQKVYLIDPNGKPTFFNNMFTEQLIKKTKKSKYAEEIITNYVDSIGVNMNMVKKLSNKQEFIELCIEGCCELYKTHRFNTLITCDELKNEIKTLCCNIETNLYCRIDEYIEKMLDQYIKSLMLEDIEYRYIYTKTWNEKNICINKHFPNSSIGNGHCVIISLLLIHYMVITKCEPYEIYKILNNLTDEQILTIINNYSANLYELMC